jgi:glutamate N-acetyltransferase/amino-acid N-acetyltransferase
MLAFITTDLALPPELLQAALSEVTTSTYNQISVDGDTSTNDMVLLMSSGTVQLPQPITSEQSEAYQAFCQALLWLNTVLAQRIVQDGEGASKTLTVHVQGAQSLAQARNLSKAVIGSNLVKTALFGEQPNWGRMLSAMGATGEAFDPQQVSLTLRSEGGTLPLMQAGQPLVIDASLAATVLKVAHIEAQVHLYQGTHQATAWGCDLTPGYVAINANYLT